MFSEYLLHDCKQGKEYIFQCAEDYKNLGEITRLPSSSAYKWAKKMCRISQQEIVFKLQAQWLEISLEIKAFTF